MRAHVLIRDQPWYRRVAFSNGLETIGAKVLYRSPDKIDKDTVLVIWNRYAGNHEQALMVERGGGTVLVAEKGYIGKGGGTPKFQVHPGGPQPDHYYAIAKGFHNDADVVNVGADDRVAALGVTFQPWRTSGEYLLVCPNRSFGIPSRMMPPDWAENKCRQLQKITNIPTRLRRHPGNDAPKRSLQEDLAGARAVFVWSSSCGVHSIAQGIPTFVDAPYWIMKSAAATGSPESLVMPERAEAFRRLSYAQWTCREIEDGTAFRHLLPATR